MMSAISDDNDASAPQEVVNEFWENLITKKPAKVTKIFPDSLYAHLLPPKKKPGTAKGKNAAESYNTAADECRARVKRIVRECRRTNEKFTDPEFDISWLGNKNCLEGLKYWLNDDPPSAPTSPVSASSLGFALSTLVRSDVLMQNAVPVDLVAASRVLNSNDNSYTASSGGPGSVHRVDWIFDAPQFSVDGFSSSDVVQGSNGDCWLIAAVATICSNPKLIERVCVERDEECGVYGFVFYRDGDWIWTVVDDNLYLRYSDFDEYGDRYDPTGVKETKYKKNNQTGSEALYFASCADENETWLPLLEKAYAKVHGDYDAIAGGWSGEAVEDLTGGVTAKVLTDRVLSREHLWKELMDANKQFLFSASSPGSYGDDSHARRGLALSHAYSIIKAVEEESEDGKKHRLVLIRNPWGKRANAAMGEWTGPWSDGSKEWTPYWMKKLGHTFGDDGLFWMSYQDLLKRFDILDRTRLFDENWTVVQSWTSVSVSWVSGYLSTKFVVEIKKGGPTVFVLAQLDDRYFKGLEGKYTFDLHFILQEASAAPGDHIVRARGAWFGNRSISAEVDLEAGIYEILPKIEATRDADATDVHEIVTKVANRNPQKLRQIGLNYDIANAKGVLEVSEEERKKKEQKEKEKKEKKKKEEEEREKEKKEFEEWKKEEKAEWDAWKKEKKEKREKEEREKEEKEKKDKKDDKEAEKKSESVMKKEHGKDGEKKGDEPAVTKPSLEDSKSIDTKPTEVTPSNPPSTSEDKIKEKPTDKSMETSTEKPADAAQEPLQPDTKPDSAPPTATGAPHLSTGVPPPSADLDTDPEADAKPVPKPPPQDDDDDVPSPPKPKEEDTKPRPWNAVCVLGLRVYSQDPEVSIRLEKPKDVEEGAVLDLDGQKAGATM